jgi:hypothetical protein
VASHASQLPEQRRAIVERFVSICQADERVVAAFLAGSHAAGTADEHSDLDLGVITTDAAYDAFLAGHAAFVRRLGEPLFLEHFDLPHNAFFILADGTEGELATGRVSAFAHIHTGPYHVLLDKQGVLDGAVFHAEEPEDAEQRERLRRGITWFWHDLSHFIAAIGRGQLWWAYGQIGELRGLCVDLARLRHDFGAAKDEYWKLDSALPPEQLAPLLPTCCALERGAMLAAADALVSYYQMIVPALAREHGLVYPDGLERILIARLERVRGAAES